MANDELGKIIDELVRNRTPEELALGWLRYEALRKLTPREFQWLHWRNLQGENFDDMVTNERIS